MDQNNDGPHNGSCLCGEIEFEARAKPLCAAYCHCRSCRVNTGAPVAAYVGFAHDQVHYVHGERAFYQSSPGVQRGFCRNCSTPMTYESKRWPGEVHIHISALHQPELFLPEAHIYCAERIPWLEIHDHLPRHPGTTSAGK